MFSISVCFLTAQHKRVGLKDCFNKVKLHLTPINGNGLSDLWSCISQEIAVGVIIFHVFGCIIGFEWQCWGWEGLSLAPGLCYIVSLWFIVSSQGECDPELMFSFNTSGLPVLQTNRLANTLQDAEAKVMEY